MACVNREASNSRLRLVGSGNAAAALFAASRRPAGWVLSPSTLLVHCFVGGPGGAAVKVVEPQWTAWTV